MRGRGLEPQPGVVYLVGAGPGAADLITVRGLRCLQKADVVFYDRLVNEELLAEAPPWAECIFVGKAPGRHTCSQAEIHTLMIQRARAGNIVVRLKGGDPFIFGRGGEEVEALATAGVPCVVVPGVTSAVGVPGAVGIPLTHRDVAGAVAIVSAHRAGEREDVDWNALARVDTLVILMGVARLSTVVELLIREGRAATTPVAIIERGTWPDERVVVGTLADIGQRARAAGIRPPATIVVGEVVSLWQALAHQEAPRNQPPISIPWSCSLVSHLPAQDLPKCSASPASS